MSAPFSARLPRWFQAGLVVLLGALATGLLFQRLSWSDWGRPHWLEGDPLEIYLRVKIAGGGATGVARTGWRAIRWKSTSA